MQVYGGGDESTEKGTKHTVGVKKMTLDLSQFQSLQLISLGFPPL